MPIVAVFAWLLFVIALLFATWFYRKQNALNARNDLAAGGEGDDLGLHTGGKISKPKALWLAYALSAWFFLPFTLFGLELAGAVADQVRLALGFHLLSWWLRAPIEGLMIYKTFNWSPRYGIAHSLFHATGLLILSWPLLGMQSASGGTDLSLLLCQIFFVAMILSALFEALFASLFLRARGHLATKIYFADDSKTFRFINRLTGIVVTLAYGHFAFHSVALSLLLIP